MNKIEFEEKIKEHNIKKISSKGLIRSFLERNFEYYTKQNEENIIYGIQRKEKKYHIFFKDTERGITTDLGQFLTEEEAYDSLFSTIKSWEQEEVKQ